MKDDIGFEDNDILFILFIVVASCVIIAVIKDNL